MARRRSKWVRDFASRREFRNRLCGGQAVCPRGRESRPGGKRQAPLDAVSGEIQGNAGGTDTPMNHANAPDAAPETRGYVESLHALKRLAEPDEIARAALFLASEASSFVTGTAMLVDGGVSITRS